MSFKGKTAVITGGGTGIGRATALTLAKAGGNVVIGNRNVERGEEVVAAIQEAGGNAIFQQTDVAQPHQVKALIDRAVREYGGLQLAFNNAGVEGEIGPLHEQSIEASSLLIDVNVKGVFYAMKYEIEQMLDDGGGSIVNTSSILGLKGSADLANYVASKHAVVGLTRAAALDYAQQEIRINAVAPGPVETRMLTDVAGGDPHAFAQLVPMGRIGQPQEIADAVLWLLSAEAQFVTGHVLTVDGGWGAK
jgi:NAD(P)-dependent dehydrogenase (short-subunit alcohol dehydrogenase family)